MSFRQKSKEPIAFVFDTVCLKMSEYIKCFKPVHAQRGYVFHASRIVFQPYTLPAPATQHLVKRHQTGEAEETIGNEYLLSRI